MKKLNKTQTNGKIYCVHGLEDNIVKIPILPKTIYRLSAVPFKIPMACYYFFFYRNGKTNSKIHREPHTHTPTHTINE